MCRDGWLGPDSPDGWRRTTKDRDGERQGGPKRQRQRGRLPSGLFPSQQPGVVLSLGASPAKRTPPPASQPVRLIVCPLPTARPPEQARLPPLPRLPPSSLSLTSFCSACAKPIWNCLNPNIQPPPPSSQIPPQFKTSLALALRGGIGGRRRRGGGRQAGGRGGSSFLFNFWGAREGGRGSALGHRSALAIAQSRHIFPINEERTWISSFVCLRKGSSHPDEEVACSLGKRRGLLPSAKGRPWGACAPASGRT